MAAESPIEAARPPRPLDGVKVIDLSRLLPGPFATLLLADLGASIFKVEEVLGGDYARFFPPLARTMSPGFAALNRDKRGLSVDLKHPRGRDVILRLCAQADVLVESFRPGVMARLGLDFQTLARENPRLIVCAITGFGQTGPLAQQAGHDLGYLAQAGLAGLTGHDDEVVMPGFQAADIAGGALYGVIGILAALYGRERTGLGRFVDASMTDGAFGLGVMLHAKDHLHVRDPLRPTRQRPGEDMLSGALLCYRPWRCQDGRYLAVGALEPKFWMAFCVAAGIPDLATDGWAEGETRTRVEGRLRVLFESRPRDEWVRLLSAHDVCVEPVLDLDEARQTAHAKLRGLFGTHFHPGEGRELLHQFPNPALLPGAEPPRDVRPAPHLGADTREVLTAFGFEPQEIDDLAAAKAIGLGTASS